MKRRPSIKLRGWPLLVAVTVGAGAAWAFRWSLGTGGGTQDPETRRAAVSLDPAPLSAPLPGPIPSTPAGPPGEKAAVSAIPASSIEAEAAAVPPERPRLEESPRGKLRFREVWAYLMPGEEALWRPGTPITDLGLFDFSLGPTGRLSGKANARAIERASREGVRTHLAIASSGNKTLLHLALSPRYGVRQALLAEIARLPRLHPVNGIQLDLEGPRAEERADLVSFVRELKAALPGDTVLSLALPAKTSDGPGAFVYSDLAGSADRFFIMVYDQHWRGGPPGAISALDWHDRVLDCAKAHLPLGRVVVGLPFYGRVWQREQVARALKHPQAEELASGAAAEVRLDPARTHSFTFRTEVTAECWFEDADSLRTKLESARSKGFTGVGFWRLGQEDRRIWQVIERE